MALRLKRGRPSVGKVILISLLEQIKGKETRLVRTVYLKARTRPEKPGQTYNYDWDISEKRAN